MKKTLFLFLALSPPPWAGAESLSTAWKWSEKQSELYSPSFSKDGREIVLVRKTHEPDGYGTESLSGEELSAFERRMKKDPRWADPRVTVLPIGEDAPEPVDYGWNPSFSPDGRTIVFSRQKNPISGSRVLADTLAGNEIVSYDRETQRTSLLARPEKGFLDAPLYSPDGTKVAYLMGDAVNGNWPAPVGVGLVDLKSRKTSALFGPEKRFGILSTVPSTAWSDEGLAMLLNQPAGGGASHADSYSVELAAVAPQSKIRTLRSWGVKKLGFQEPIFHVLEGGTLLVFDGAWHAIDFKKGTISPRRDIQGSPEGGVISPDGKRVAFPKDTKLSVKPLIGGGRPIEWTGEGRIIDVRWSPNSKRLALILNHENPKGNDSLFSFDELTVLDMR